MEAEFKPINCTFRLIFTHFKEHYTVKKKLVQLKVKYLVALTF